MKKKDTKWLYFLMSIGTIFIMLSQSDQGAVEHIYLGLLLIGIALIMLMKNSKRNR